MTTEFLRLLYAIPAALPFEAMEAVFMQRAAIALFLLSSLCAVMGVLVIHFRLAFFSDAVAHSAFTGIAVGLLLGWDPWLGVMVCGLVTGIGAILLRRSGDFSMDTGLGVLFSTLIALGLVIISANKGLARTLPAFLYGDVLLLRDADILGLIALSVVVAIFLGLTFNRLLHLSLHEHLARAGGTPGMALELGFAALLSIWVGFAIKVVGILLVTALLVVPAAAGRNLARSLGGQVRAAVLLSWMSAGAGLATSVLFDTATGATLVLWGAAGFLVSLLVPFFRGNPQPASLAKPGQ